MTKRLDAPSAAVRIRVMKRDRFTCVYCGISGQEAELEIDHIIAVAKGGSHHISNLVTACLPCNQRKGTGEMSRIDIKAKSPQQHGLTGMYLHTLTSEGRLEKQGQIIAVDGDIALVQLFEWAFGEPTIVEPMQVQTIYKNCRLYKEHREFIRAHLIQMQQDGTLRGSIEMNLGMYERYD